MFEPCSCSALCLRGDIGLGKNWREHDCGGGGTGVDNGEAMERRTGMDRTVRWGVRAARCSPLSEGWSCVVEWWKEGDDDGKGIGGVDEVNENDTIVVVDGDCRWKKDGRWLHSEKMQHRRGLICKQ